MSDTADLRLYNSLTRQTEPFQPAGDPVRIYVCGITPYAAAHLGHGMSLIIFDVLRRFLEWRGQNVRFVYNYTDVDDKMIASANRSGGSVAELAERQISAFEEDCQLLNIQPASVNPRATEEIPQIITIIGGLIERGVAYATEGDVYYRVTAPSGYGKLSRRTLDDMIAGSRIDVSDRKEHPMDFALWKGAKDGEPSWDSPWGAGRPGWHIECSAMVLHYLGEQIDLHGGGMDLIFPHHENEIAQSESFTGKAPFVRHWMHHAMMQLGDEKMSKSLGNIINLHTALEQYGPDALRLFVLNGHYRSPLKYSEESLAAAARGAERLRFAVSGAVSGAAGGATGAEAERRGAGPHKIPLPDYRTRFTDALADDLGTPQALASLFDLGHAINRARDAGEAVGDAVTLLQELGGVLGLQFLDRSAAGGAEAAAFVDLLVEIRMRLREAKQFALADTIRDRLADLGVGVKDGHAGTTWRALLPEASPAAGPNPPESLPSDLERALRF